MKHKLICLLVLLTGLALLGSPATAQDISTKGGISGTVVDATGAIVPGATVTITGPIAVRDVVSNAQGQYEVSNLIPGKYTVKASLAGFKTASMSDVTVYVGKMTSVRLSLSAGDVSETIEVVSVVGRFLEHSRIYSFERPGEEPRLYIGSADLMPRNLYNRVELVVPVSDPQCRAELLDVLDRSLADNANAWELSSDGEWVRRTPGDPPRAVQRELIERAQARAAESTSP